MLKTTKALSLLRAGYTEIISVSPPGAKFVEGSKLKEQEAGKSPARKVNATQWAGYNWRALVATNDHAKFWDSNGANIGLRADLFPAIDIDCLNPEVAEHIQNRAFELLGPAPVRFGRKPKRLLVYVSEKPFARMRLWFSNKNTGEMHLVEALGAGQQYVVAGTHPSGSEYGWVGKALHETDPFDLVAVTPEKIQAFFGELEADLDVLGYKIEKEGSGALAEDREGVDQGNLAAPSLAAIQEVVAAIPNTNDAYPGRDDYLRIGYAIKASGGEAAFDVFLDWAMRWEGNDRWAGNDEGTVADDWARMVPPYSVGWEFLLHEARRFKFDDTALDFGPGVPAPTIEEQAEAIENDEQLDESVVLYSERNVAKRWVRKYGDEFRYSDPLGGWMVYEDGHWSRDDLLRAEYKAGKLCGRYAAKAYGDDRLEKNARLTALKMASNAAKNNILSIAKSNPYIAVAQQAFDANPWLLNTPEGTVDLKTGEIRTHDSSDLLTKMTQVAPKPGEPTRFLSFLEEALQGDREYIRHVQKWLGYCLTGSTLEQKLAFFWGPGGNGKSVLLNTVQHIMGDYSRVTDTSTFAAQKNDQHPEALADLRGARLVAANETQEGRAWDEAKIKQATGGDKISARFLNRDRFEFTPTFKLLFVGNHKPKIANIDRAMRRRIHLMPFTVTPTVVDRNLEDKLKEEAGQILSWLIEGCLLWQKEGLEPPKIVQDATDDYFEDEDPIGRFLEERCVVKDGAAVLGSALFESWREWAEQQNESTRSLRWLVGQLTTRGGIGKWREPHTGRRGLRGLELIYNPGEFEAQPAPKTAKA